MGCVFCKRRDLLIRPYYHVEADQQTGLIKTSWFDNVIVLKLKGLLYAGQAIITRLHQWRLEQAVGRSSLLLGTVQMLGQLCAISGNSPKFYYIGAFH